MSDQFTYKIFRKFDQELGNLWISFEKNKIIFKKLNIKNLINLSESSNVNCGNL